MWYAAVAAAGECEDVCSEGGWLLFSRRASSLGYIIMMAHQLPVVGRRRRLCEYANLPSYGGRSAWQKRAGVVAHRDSENSLSPPQNRAAKSAKNVAGVNARATPGTR